MAIANANSLRILALNSDGTKIPIAHAQSASISISNSLIDVTTKSSMSWAQKISGQKSFSVSADGLVDYGVVAGQSTANALGEWAISGEEIFFDFGIASPEAGYRGSGFISSYEQSGGTDDAPTYSISIESNGMLNEI